MRFKVRSNGPGSYTFEAVAFPGFFLTVDDGQNRKQPFLAEVYSAWATDPRFRFELYASSKDLKYNLMSFDPVLPCGSGMDYDSRVLMTERLELSRI
jgi:hypothetical protein